jgi:hypothetical protein
MHQNIAQLFKIQNDSGSRKNIFITKTRNLESTKFILSFFRAFACPVKPFFLFNRGPSVLS